MQVSDLLRRGAQLEPGESGLAFLPTVGLVGDAGFFAAIIEMSATEDRVTCVSGCIVAGGMNADAKLQQQIQGNDQ